MITDIRVWNLGLRLGSVQVLLDGVGGLTENADAADASRGGVGSQVKMDDVILEHISVERSVQIILSIFN